MYPSFDNANMIYHTCLPAQKSNKQKIKVTFTLYFSFGKKQTFEKHQCVSWKIRHGSKNKERTITDLIHWISGQSTKCKFTNNKIYDRMTTQRAIQQAITNIIREKVCTHISIFPASKMNQSICKEIYAVWWSHLFCNRCKPT